MKDEINDLINKLVSYPKFNIGKYLLHDTVITQSKKIVTDSIKANVESQAKTGLQPKVVRSSSGKCCTWCDNLVGVYKYPNIPEDVYRRHRGCTCTVDYYPGDGRIQNVHSKKWYTKESERTKYNYMNYEDLQYRPIKRGTSVSNFTTGFENIKTKKIENAQHEIYMSEKLILNPKKFHELEEQITKSIKLTNIDVSNKPKIVFVDITEVGNASGRYDSINNVVYLKISNKEDIQAHVTTHELFHCKDAQEYVKKNGKITDEEKFIQYNSKRCKEKLDKLGISGNNVGEISKYAKEKYEIGRFDETYAEYRVKKVLKDRKRG